MTHPCERSPTVMPFVDARRWRSALFALGSGVSLWAGPWLLLRLGQNGRGAWSMRVAGLALMLTSAWGLYMGLVHDQAPWCVVPSTH